MNDGNLIQTVPGKGWFVILRLYSPLEPFFTRLADRARSKKLGAERGLCYLCGQVLLLAPLLSLLTLTPGRKS